MNPKNRRRVRTFVFFILMAILCFIAFLLYETKDEINANLSNIDAQLNRFYNPERMAGFAVSVFNADSIIYTNGFGYADFERQIPYTAQTQQYIASVSKTTIGLALMKAEELGLLNIDDPINKHLPFSVSNPKYPDRDITIKHLATHTSSLDYNETVVESLYTELEVRSLAAFMICYFQEGSYGKVAFTDDAPGTNWSYSNIGASLAAYIIEEVSATTFDKFTQTHILDPLELHNTAWFRSESDSLLHTTYYEAGFDTVNQVKTSGVRLYPSRDLITNIEDLTIYCQALVAANPKLLSVDSYEKLLSPQLDNSVANQSEDNNGLFFMIDRNNYGITYQLTGMDGGDNCINTMMWFDQKSKLGYIFMGNTGFAELNRSNHIWIYRTLVSLGDNFVLNNSNTAGRINHKLHNLYNRIRAIF